MARRILRELKLDKIAAVDRPCQEGATMTIMKRDFTADERQAMADKGEAMSDGSYPIANTSDLENAIQSFGRAKDKAATKSHIITRAKALGAEDKIPADWVAKADDTEIAGNQAGDTVSKGDTQMSDDIKKVADLEKAVAELTKTIANLTKMSAAHAAYDGKMPKGGKAAFEAMTPDERDAHIEDMKDGGKDDASENADGTKKFADAVAKAAKNDEVLKVGELEIRKSAVGDANFAIFKAQQAEIAKARDEAEMERLQKRAETELDKLPGEVVAKAKVLKAIASMSAEDKAVLDTMLKAGRDAIAKGFQKIGIGHGAPDAGNPESKLEAMAKAKAEKENVPYATAYDKVLKSAEGNALYAEIRNARMSAAE